MLAARMYGKNDLRLEEVPVPTLQPGELLVRVKAAAICGTDLRMVRNGAKGIDGDHPCILGHELAGVIEALGEGTTGYEVGQRVAVAPNMGCGVCDMCVAGKGHLCPTYKALGINLDGGFAEFCRIPREAVQGGNVCLLSEGISFEEAALGEPLSCVCNGFERAGTRAGDTVLVIGAGPIGIMHCALSLMTGANVYLNDISEERLEEAVRLYPAIRPVRGDPEKAFMPMTGNRGADVIITACPVPSVQAAAVRMAAMEGRVIFFGGVPADRQPVGIDTNLIHYKQLMVSGTTRASLTQYRKTLRWIESGVLNVKPLITARFPLAQIGEAMDRAARAEGMKNVVTF